jgi:hypothetical protein
MKYTGSILFNVFAGDENRQPMTRAIVRIGSREYALYLNVTDGGTIAAAHAVTGRNGNSPIIDKNALAQCVCDSVEGLEGVEFILPELEFDNIRLVDFAVTAERTNPNDNQYRLAMPLDIAKVRFNVKERKATGTDDASANVI